MKQIRDPIYGYINIDDKYFYLIDKSEFQRLRNICQTGYQALYPSALHNRFVHSLGVLYLGRKALACFQKNVRGSENDKASEEEWDKWVQTFELACLLHDVGHSPFSHSGEDYYKATTNFMDELKNLIPNEEFNEDIKSGYGNPHEAMSAIVGFKLIKDCGVHFNFDEEMFVRAIIGVPYAGEDKLILNTIIGMLNGNVIDVDKLDYLIRDSYVTGYSSMALDVDRLLSGYTIAKYIGENNIPREVAAYKKGSLSVIENVVCASDLERRWIQGNPTILYDCKLVEFAIKNYDEYMQKQYPALKEYSGIFNQLALSKEGFPEESNIPVKLLSDADVISYIKSFDKTEVGKQFFERKERLKPLWKNGADFEKVVKDGLGDGIRRDFRSTLKAATSPPHSMFFLNEDTFEEEKEKLEQEKAISEGSDNCKAQKQIVKIYKVFSEFSAVNNYIFKFAVICDRRFESNYQKLALGDIFVELAPTRVIKFNKSLAIEAIKADEEGKEGLFYIYTARENIFKAKKDKKDLAEVFIKYISNHWNNQI